MALQCTNEQVWNALQCSMVAAQLERIPQMRKCQKGPGMKRRSYVKDVYCQFTQMSPLLLIWLKRNTADRIKLAYNCTQIILVKVRWSFPTLLYCCAISLMQG